MTYYKIINDPEIYNVGLHILDDESILTFSDNVNIFKYYKEGTHVIEITLPTHMPNFRVEYDEEKEQYSVNMFVVVYIWTLRDVTIYKILADAGANISDNYLLRRNIEWNEISIIKFLVENGSKPVNENIIFCPRTQNDYLPMLKYLIEDCGLDIHFNNDYLLFLNAYQGNMHIIEYLLENGVDIHNYRAFDIAIEKTKGNIIRFFIERGLDIHYKGDYALRQTALKGDLSLCQFLIDRGADIYAKDGQVLVNAVDSGSSDLVIYLLQLGAKIMFDDILNNPAEKNHIELVKILVENGAKVTNNVIKLAARKGHLDIVKFLAEKGADIKKVLESSIANGHIEVAKYLIKMDTDINRASILHYCIFRDDVEVIKFLIENGIDMYAHNNFLFNICCQVNNILSLKYLVGIGYDINSNGTSALKFAIRGGHLPIIKYLVEHGADTNTLDNIELTPEILEYFDTIKN